MDNYTTYVRPCMHNIKKITNLIQLLKENGDVCQNLGKNPKKICMHGDH
jgi:hypothetical protein